MSDQTPPPPGYPGTPSYGTGGTPPTRNPFAGGRPVGRTTGRTPRPEPASRASTWTAVGLALAWNLLALLGVLVWNWPPGNVFLLFWAENAVLGVATLVKVVTAGGPPGTITVNGTPRPGSPGLYGLFFTLHYGIFCTVHLVFTAIVAYRIGIEPSFLLLGLPVVLLVLRYAVETATSWFGAGGQRASTAPGRAMFQAYPRVVVLHVAVLLTFGLVLEGPGGSGRLDTWTRWARPLLELLPAEARTQGVLVVGVLLLVKTVVDLAVLTRLLRPR